MWTILLDSQSTCDVIVNAELISNIRECDWTLKLQTQAGSCKVKMIRDMKGVGTVWFYPKRVANILLQFRMATYSG